MQKVGPGWQAPKGSGRSQPQSRDLDLSKAHAIPVTRQVLHDDREPGSTYSEARTAASVPLWPCSPPLAPLVQRSLELFGSAVELSPEHGNAGASGGHSDQSNRDLNACVRRHQAHSSATMLGSPPSL